MAMVRIPCLFLAIVGVVFAIALAGRPAAGGKDEFRFDAATLKDSALWTQVNAEPYRLSIYIDTLCRAPMAQDYENERKINPHAASYITVYVNNVGRDAMFAKDGKKFPEGSVIVKQKIGNRTEGSKPLLYTIMRKREAGYNPTVGDWEFLVVGPDGKELQASGRLEKCESCHKGKTDSDHVFRPYLTSNN
jgi:hypothetical protein